MKINTIAFVLTFGIWCGSGLFIVTWWLIGTGAGPNILSLIEGLYPGYTVTALGSVIGLVGEFFCAAICGGILTRIYNFLVERIGSGASARTAKPA